MRRAISLLLAGTVIAGCGHGDDPAKSLERPQIGVKGGDARASQGLGFPTFATKNTTRVGGADAVADAAAVAQAVFPARSGAASRPTAVTLVGEKDWQVALAASVHMARPVRAPVLLTDGADVPAATTAALGALAPTGAKEVGGAQAVRIGSAGVPKGLRTTDVGGKDPYALVSGIDRLATAAAGTPSPAVIVVPDGAPRFAMPAAGYAAKAGTPILFSRRQALAPGTAQALRRHERPKIYVLGPKRLIGGRAIAALRRLGTVQRIGADDAVANAIAFARFTDGSFGWGVVDAGHGLVFANPGQPLAAPAAAALSASGTYGPLLLTDERGGLPDALAQYLLDIQPGYRRDPVRGVYNRGWLIGDERALTASTQSRIDALLEITRERTTGANG